MADGPSDVDRPAGSINAAYKAAIKAATAIVNEEMERASDDLAKRSRVVRKAQADAQAALSRVKGRLKELGREGFTGG